ncbi:hypothetical protein VB734_09190 [Synechococcus sp. BA-124 BA4]|uniref:hypothetical protein n=1 Tax=unclassified Synechococcus TaxID=2626047 RepID=UPI0018CD1047|nr:MULTISPECIES: hypothetical protein [unclassified Synechococcus]MEA5400211.1 hypothetical protein [Synechococcus sp. BA-124 BA4]QPN57352.1 hypothetical protein I1E95_04300 [Synechococcus sp. CBW1107]CAK6692861.1 hypothetical protein BBFGKLBO_01319 [Synechococcus sp. CBW1107]
MVFLPPTSDFPPDPEPLSREDLNSVYLELRNCYKSSMISRGQYRSRSIKARDETATLRQNLLDLAAREASVRTDIYQMLEIVTAIAGDLEDAGDDIVNEFGRYKLGRRTYQGGSFLGGLVQAVIRFINRWTRTKEKVVELDQKRQEFIEKTKELPPLTLGGNGHKGSVSLSEPVVPATVETVDSSADPQAEQTEAHGPDH